MPGSVIERKDSNRRREKKNVIYGIFFDRLDSSVG